MKCPKASRKSVHILTNRLCLDEETVHNMMLITAALMDLSPDDDEVVEMILMDCDAATEKCG